MVEGILEIRREKMILIILCMFFSFGTGFFFCALFALGKIKKLEETMRYQRDLLRRSGINV